MIPVIPFVLWFDAILSCLRAYSPAELSQLISHLKANDYNWQIGEVTGRLAPVTFMVGYPDRHDLSPSLLEAFHSLAPLSS